MPGGDIYTLRSPKRLAIEASKRGFDVDALVIEALIEKLNLDLGGEAATRIELAEHFLEEAKKYIDAGDAAQAFEKLYKAAEERVKAPAVKFQVSEAEKARGEGG